MNILKRDGTTVPFEQRKIAVAIGRCLNSPEVSWTITGDPFVVAAKVAGRVANIVTARDVSSSWQPTVENIQNLVEQQLMAAGLYDAAKYYILYRNERAAKRDVYALTPEEAAVVHSDRQYFDTELQAFQFKDKYARWNPVAMRRETWQETCSRVIGFFQGQLASNPAFHAIKWQELADAMLNMEALPSLRVVQMAGPALERCHVGVYNCAYTGIEALDDFAEILYVMMQGTGCGYSVEIKHVENLPRIKRQKGELSHMVVDDSTEGWCNALKVGMAEWFAGRDVEFDYSLIRPEGAILVTKGGRASGPEPLKRLLDFTRDKVLSRQGAWLRTIDAHDIACMCGEIVHVGGVRRAAEISLSDLDDHDMRNAKSGNWYHATKWRQMANNSAVYEEKPSSEDFMEEFLSLIKSRSGERGIFNRGSLDKQLPKHRKKGKAFGCNPCGEIILRSKQFCNLSIAVARPDDTAESLKRKVRIASIFGTLQSTLTNFAFIGPEWKKNCEEERLLGVDIIGQFDCELLRYSRLTSSRLVRADLLKSLKAVAVTTNRTWAELLEIPVSAAVTCVKPGGNSSVLLNANSGMHPRMFKHFVRRVTVGRNTPISKVLLDAGVPHVVRDATSLLFEFPESAPDGAMVEADMSAHDQLENFLDWKTSFTDHNPSMTVKVAEDEWLKVANWVYEHWDQIGGLTFLQKETIDTVYAGQLPYEAITEKEFNRRVAAMPVVDYAKLARYEREDMTTVAKEFACTANGCELK